MFVGKIIYAIDCISVCNIVELQKFFCWIMSVEEILNYEFESHGPFWHLCTPGDLSGLLFRETKDFVYGMNLVAHAVAVHKKEVDIYTFVIMSNHFHFVLRGNQEDCISFFNFIFRRLKRYLSLHGRISDLDGFNYKLFEISDLYYMRNVIAYINRNPYVANSSYTPYNYSWGTSSYLFNSLSERIIFTPLSKFTVRQLRSIFFTRNVDFPTTFRFIDGYVVPSSYCKISQTEQYFRSPSHYFHILSRQVESYALIAREIGDWVTYTDDELFSVAVSLSIKDYDIKKISELDKDQKIAVATKLHFNYNATNKQLKRVLRLDEVVLDSLFPMSKRSPGKK